jgi:hypothetical protein
VQRGAARRIGGKLALLALSISTALVAGEILVRTLGSYDADGKFFDRSHEVIHTDADLLAEARASSLDSLFRGHYSPRGYRIVAAAVSRYLLEP